MSSNRSASSTAFSRRRAAAVLALLAEDPHALLMEDERQMAPAAIAARDGHPWLQDALARLTRERVVCVRSKREATLQRPLGSVGSLRRSEEQDADARREPDPAAVLVS